MTLCIAAACRYNENPAIALVSDTRSLSGSRDWGLTISSENANKNRTMGDFSALVAGDPTKADELLGYFDTAIKKFSAKPHDDDFDLHMNELFEDIRQGARKRKKQIQDHFIAMNFPFGGSDDFLVRAKASLPDAQFREVWNELRSLNLGTEVILAGFHGDEIVILKIDLNGEPHWEDQYSVIGTGSADALSFLAQNEFDENDIELGDCLLRVVEALQFAANSNNTVGSTKRFYIHTYGSKETQDINNDFFEYLKSKRRLDSVVKLEYEGEMLQPHEEVESSSEPTIASVEAAVPNPEQ